MLPKAEMAPRECGFNPSETMLVDNDKRCLTSKNAPFQSSTKFQPTNGVFSIAFVMRVIEMSE